MKKRIKDLTKAEAEKYFCKGKGNTCRSCALDKGYDCKFSPYITSHDNEYVEIPNEEYVIESVMSKTLKYVETEYNKLKRKYKFYKKKTLKYKGSIKKAHTKYQMLETKYNELLKIFAEKGIEVDHPWFNKELEKYRTKKEEPKKEESKFDASMNALSEAIKNLKAIFAKL